MDKTEQNSSVNRKTLLIVDDSPTVLQTAQFILAKYFHVVTADDGLSGLQRFHEEHPDLVLLDINLPKINGHKVLQEMLKLNPDAYIIMISSNAFKEEIIKSHQEGAKGFVAKPFAKKQLDDAIEKWRKETQQPIEEDSAEASEPSEASPQPETL